MRLMNARAYSAPTNPPKFLGRVQYLSSAVEPAPSTARHLIEPLQPDLYTFAAFALYRALQEHATNRDLRCILHRKN